MPLGIKPTVDFAFKKIFGSPENVRALIGLLNAILKLPDPIVEALDLDELNRLCADLRQRLRSRGNSQA